MTPKLNATTMRWRNNGESCSIKQNSAIVAGTFWGERAASAQRRDKKEEEHLKHYYVYILTNRSRNLYIGVTNNLQRRIYEHQHHLVAGFTSQYLITRLVYFEETCDVYAAIGREKQIKGWSRTKKIALIESINPDWRDLSQTGSGAYPCSQWSEG